MQCLDGFMRFPNRTMRDFVRKVDAEINHNLGSRWSLQFWWDDGQNLKWSITHQWEFVFG